MPSGMGVTNPKFAKSVRKPKKTKQCTILNGDRERKFPKFELQMRNGSIKLNRRKSKWYPKHEVWGSLLKKLEGEKGSM